MNEIQIDEPSTTLVITEGGSTVVVTDLSTTTVTAITQGPQGPQGPPGPAGLVVDTTAKIDKSVVYYDAASAGFKADTVWTVSSLTDGGNF